MFSAEQLQKKIATLKHDISELERREACIVAQLQDKDYAATAKNHIRLLHEYNEIRDLAHFLLSKIAVHEQTTQAAIMARFSVSQDD